MKEKKIAAFFDIDGTLYRDSLMTEHFKKLIKYEVVDEKYWLNGVKDSYINWDKRFEDYDNYLLHRLANIFRLQLRILLIF